MSFIPVSYAIAMATGALAALFFGRLYDRVGPPILLVAFTLSALFPPFVFFGSGWVALLGMVLWGLGMGAQDSLLKSVVAGITPTDRRGTAFGIFDTGFGLAWFLGSLVMGLLYAYSIEAVVIFSVTLQLASLPFFYLAGRAPTQNAAAN